MPRVTHGGHPFIPASLAELEHLVPPPAVGSASAHRLPGPPLSWEPAPVTALHTAHRCCVSGDPDRGGWDLGQGPHLKSALTGVVFQ